MTNEVIEKKVIQKGSKNLSLFSNFEKYYPINEVGARTEGEYWTGYNYILKKGSNNPSLFSNFEKYYPINEVGARTEI